MKKNHFELKNYVMATGVFILAVIAGILIFFECVQRAVQVNSQNTLKINVQRQSEHLRTILDINYQYLNEIASAMGRSEELFSEENKQKMKDLGPDKVKELANEKLEKLRIVVVAENNDEIIQRAKELQKEMSCTSYNKKIQVLKSFKIDDNISADDIAKLYEEKLTGCELEFDLDEGESLKDYFQRQINKDGKTSIVNELKKDIA